jgi:chemotaxis protein CheD
MKVYDGSRTEDDDAVAEPDRRKVGIAEYDVTTDGAVLTTSGLGSCIGLALYDTRAGVAGLIHVMLPRAEDASDGAPAKFADAGTRLLADEMVEAGATRTDLEAKLAGGSDMLDFSQGEDGIGKRNAAAVRATLEELSIPVVGEDVGGDHGRSLKLEGATGDLVVTCANRESVRL